MTREETFRQSFSSNFAVYSGFSEQPVRAKSILPPSAFPSFSLSMGKTRLYNYTLSGHALSGDQEFSVTVYFMKPLHASPTAISKHSDLASLVQGFINDPIYLPPLVLPGDTFRIDAVEVISVDPMQQSAETTRFTMTLHGKYLFSII